MRASFRYVIRNLGRRRLRAAAGILGTFLTLALLVALQVGLDSVSTSYADLVALQAGRADVLITARNGHPLQPEPFDPAPVRETLRTHPELRGLSPRWIRLVQVASANREQDALLVGVDPAAERALDLWGLEPAPRLEGTNCALSRELARRLGVTAGDRVSVSGPYGGQTELSIETVVDHQRLVPQEVREILVVNDALARSILGETDRVHVLAGSFREAALEGRDLHASVLRLKRLGESIAEALGLEFEVRLPKATALTAFENVASPLRAVFGVFAVLALSVTGLLIYSIVSVAVEERIREYGILRTLGGRRADVLRLVLGESVVLCGLGVLPGVLAGTVLARAMVLLVELAMHAEAGTVALSVSTTNLLLALAAGTALSLGSALVPAVQASRWRIVDALDPLRRGQVGAEPRRDGQTNRPLLLTGTALSALSVVVFFVLPTAFLSGNSSLIGTVVLCLLLTILLGFTLLAAGVLPRLEHVVMGALRVALGPAAELAQRNLERHRRRNTTTALMFILSVSLVIFVASLVALVSRMSLSLVEHANGADLRLESGEPGAPGIKAELARVAGVEGVSEVELLRSRTEGGTAYDVVLSDLVNLKHVWLVPFGVDAALPQVLFTNQIRYADGGPEALRRLADFTPTPSAAGGTPEPPPVILSLAAARLLEVRAGDLVQLAFHLGPVRRTGRFRVAAVCETFAGFENVRARVAQAIGSGLLMPLSSFREFTRDAPAEARLVRYFIKVGSDAAVQKAAATEIRDRFGLRFRFGVRSAAERKQEAQVIYWTTQVFFGLLLAVAVVIAVFALIASMATSVIERRWEMGMLRALGLRRAQLSRMFLAEALGLTLSAGAAGGAIGFALAWLLVLEVGRLAELPVVFTAPYVTFFATFAISVGAGAVAAHLPTRRLLRQPPAEVLRQEA